MEELIKAMSDEKLKELKGEYADNPSVVTLIEGILATREKEAKQVKVKAIFEKEIGKLFAKLPHPDNIGRVTAHWGEVEVEVGEPEEVELTTTPSIQEDWENIPHPDFCKKYGVTIEDFEAIGEMLAKNKLVVSRIPRVKQYQWIVELNPVNRLTASGTPATPTASKRAITVFKRNGTSLEPQGNFASASKACEKLGLTIGGDSATRVLARDGYISEPYDGVDFTG